MKIVVKNGRKVEAIYSLTFCHFLLQPFSKMKKVAKNGRNIKAIALLFRPFFKNEKSG
jgi:predicted RNA-binding protein YlqC (UPF0109 family)